MSDFEVDRPTVYSLGYLAFYYYGYSYFTYGSYTNVLRNS